MKRFLDFARQIDEKQIQYNNNANYGQVVFFAGGAGSGKGFSIANFIDSSKFRVRDVDKLKLDILRMPAMQRKYPEIRTLSLKRPEDVRRLHEIAKAEGIPDEQIKSWIKGMSNPDTLPNILFDTTMKDLDEVDKYVPALIAAGYKPENIHVTWVLANFHVAVKRNSERERVVPDDILLKTHTGAALTVASFFTHGVPKSINGSITIILNNFEEVTYYDQLVPEYDREKLRVAHGAQKTNRDGTKQFSRIVKDFKYVTVKRAGRPMPSFQELDKQIKQTISTWVGENAPNDPRVRAAFQLR